MTPLFQQILLAGLSGCLGALALLMITRFLDWRKGRKGEAALVEKARVDAESLVTKAKVDAEALVAKARVDADATLQVAGMENGGKLLKELLDECRKMRDELWECSERHTVLGREHDSLRREHVALRDRLDDCERKHEAGKQENSKIRLEMSGLKELVQRLSGSSLGVQAEEAGFKIEIKKDGGEC
jgi:hypothetical protein